MSNVETIFPKVREIIADVLVIDEDDITPDAKLITQLGAESIDFLDLLFQLEKEFNVKIPRGQIVDDVRSELNGAEFESQGVVTTQGYAALKQHMSEVNPADFPATLKVNDIPSLFTVTTICKIVLNAQKKENIAA